MTPNAVSRAAAIMIRARDDGGPFGRLPADIRPATLEEGYAIQDEVIRQRAASGLAQAGWKIGCTSRVMQEMLGLDEPGGGAVLAADVHASPARMVAAVICNPVAECEIAVRITRDVEHRTGGHDGKSIAAYVATCMAAIEVAELRMPEREELAVAEMVADDFYQKAVVMGGEIPDWHALDLASLRATTTVSGAFRGEGRGGDSLGHPFNAVAWLANGLEARGNTLRAGHIVLTGSLVAAAPVAQGDDIVCAIEGLGEARLTMV